MRVKAGNLVLRGLLLLLLVGAWPASADPSWEFREASLAVGIDAGHGWPPDEPVHDAHLMAGGAAVADIDGDGWLDLYTLSGTTAPNRLFRNRRDGTFEEVAAAAGLAIVDHSNGPAFYDLDGDGDVDLLLGGIEGTPPRLFENLGRGTFREVPASQSGLVTDGDTWSAAAGDFDRDGDLDLFLAHWQRGPVTTVPPAHLWRNDGGLHFTPIDFSAGIASAYQSIDKSFSPGFADLDGDGWPEILVSGDFGTTRIFANQRDGTFDDVTDSAVITDENGMGAALADYDEDGDIDFFVTSIWDPDGIPNGNWGTSGNRLYRNRGDGTFEDATVEAGVRQGYWGWGACFADFDNDGDLDLFHTNGFSANAATEFHLDPARLFLSRGDGTFEESSATFGPVQPGQGRGVICFDADRDGDLDLLVAQNSGPHLFFRNEGPANDAAHGRAFFDVRLHQQENANSQGIGALVTLRAGGRTQHRLILPGSNFLSQNPPEAHFGLGSADHIDNLEVRWPDGEISRLENLVPGRLILLERGNSPAVEIPLLSFPLELCFALLLLAAACRQLTPNGG